MTTTQKVGHGCITYSIVYPKLDDLHGTAPRTLPPAGSQPSSYLFNLTKIAREREEQNKAAESLQNSAPQKTEQPKLQKDENSVSLMTIRNQEKVKTRKTQLTVNSKAQSSSEEVEEANTAVLNLDGALTGAEDLENPLVSGVDPNRGFLPPEADKDGLEYALKHGVFKKYVPSIFNRVPLKEVSEYGRGEVINSFSMLESNPGDLSRVRVLQLDLGRDAPSKKIKTFKTMLKKTLTPASMPDLEVLVLRHAQIKDCDLLHFPKLRVCDLASNSIQRVAELEKLAAACPELEVLNMIENPVAERQDVFSRIIGSAPRLIMLNGKTISVELRCKCLDLLGNEEYKANREFFRWDLCLCQVPIVGMMRSKPPGTWNPQALTKLVLSNQGLECLHVGEMINLTLLNVQGNKIKMLAGSGLEQLQQLEEFNIADNLLVKTADLDILQYLTSLRRLNMTGNNLPEDYVHYVLFETRNLRGNNFTTGLLMLNEKPVTIQQKAEAMAYVAPRLDDLNKKKAKAKKKNEKKNGQENDEQVEEEDSSKLYSPGKYFWNLALMERFGHAQIFTKEYVVRIVKMDLSGIGLTYANLTNFPSLQMVKLDNNKLRRVHGLSSLTHLKYLNLLNNPNLEIDSVHASLTNVTSLRSLALGVTSPESAPRFAGRQKYRSSVICRYAFRNPGLAYYDERPITILEYIEALRCDETIGSEIIEKYRHNLAIAVCSNIRVLPSFTIDNVAVGKYYRQDDVMYLNHLNGLGLCAPFSYRVFKNLRELNLSRNGITDLAAIGIDGLEFLHGLDVSYNKINTSLEIVAEILDSLPSLEAVALRGNPNMSHKDSRSKLLSLLRGLRQVKPILRIVDSEITIDERMAAVVAGGVPEKEAEKLRFSFCMLHIVPEGPEMYGMVTVLDLRSLALTTINLSGLFALHTLMLRGNKLTRATPPPSNAQGQPQEGLVGIGECSFLAALDLRDNKITDLDDIVQLVMQVPSLQSIGISGNPFRGMGSTSGSEFNAAVRQHFIMSLYPLWTQSRYPLGSVDENLISVQEIVNCAALSVKNRVKMGAKPAEQAMAIFKPKNELAPFNVALLRMPPMSADPSTLVELRLDHCGITEMNLSVLRSLQRLSLSNNMIESPHLASSGIEKLKTLFALDLRYNRIKDKKSLKRVLVSIPALKQVWLIPNPCYPEASEKYKKKMAALQSDCHFKLVDGFDDTLHYV